MVIFMNPWFVKILLLSLVLFILFQWMPSILLVLTNPDPNTIQQHFLQLDIQGIISVILLQFLQVFLSFLPAFPIQIASGMAYGMLWGTLFCFLGYAFANCLFFLYLKHKYTPDTLQPIIQKKLRWFSFLLNMKNKKHLILILYFIPLIPNVLKPYISVSANLSFQQFFKLLASSLIPILSSVWIGVAIVHKWYPFAIFSAIFSSVGTLFVGIWLYYKDRR